MKNLGSGAPHRKTSAGPVTEPPEGFADLVDFLDGKGLGPLAIRPAIVNVARQHRSDRRSLLGEPPELPTKGAEL